MTAVHLPKLDDRSSGLLLHPTSLAGGPENGDLGDEARRFVDFLAAAGQRWWQMLPVGPAGYGGSPYSAQSAFAGNAMLVSLDRLVEDGLLPAVDVAQAREPQLRAAFAAFVHKGGDPDLDVFGDEARGWLEDFALYRALKRAYRDVQWTLWPAPLRDRDPSALAEAKATFADEIAYGRFVEWRFWRDFKALRAYAHARGVALIGDIPIFTAHDSADVWQHRDLFTLDPTTGEPALVAGVPPDYFSETGQRWGNPLYRWERMRARGFPWWIERFRAMLSAFDAVRIDHFIGFCRYWEIPAEETTAINGHWREGPGAPFFEAVKGALGELPLIAEDLGAVTADVTALRDRYHLPGIKVLQFAFATDDATSDFLPHNYPRRAVVYTGTHDNDTSAGWYFDPGGPMRTPEETENERRRVRRYLGLPPEHDGHDIHWHLIRLAMASVANVAIFPVQDVLGLGSDARMNRPGTDRGNWRFRLAPGALTPAHAGRLKELTATYGRLPPAAP
jgi:4-alpha-glucanotransferase